MLHRKTDLRGETCLKNVKRRSYLDTRGCLENAGGEIEHAKTSANNTQNKAKLDYSKNLYVSTQLITLLGFPKWKIAQSRLSEAQILDQNVLAS